ncbi:DUF554 family protein [Paenibacillus amylolyticus]|uniref:DUF554 family protein n=1 Tax=Paenibacillus amylolyticus TaxID=1451 RepID=UPI0024C11311|nr:DUF554 family protein [Paenibacillus amylolyticus]MCL6660895.1 DUF554 domain-containing protein [Paenibacillus amylolyticus]
MLGIFNCFSIICRNTLGAISKRFMNEGYKSILNQVIGISALIIGMSTTMSSISTSQYQIMFIIFLTLGGIIGQLINFENILSNIMTTNIMNEITLIGGILALCTGLNILKITKINVLNLLPALFIPIFLL